MTGTARRTLRIGLLVAALALPSVVAGVAAIWLSRTHVPTRVHLTATVERLNLTVGGVEPARVVHGASFQSLQATRFSRVRITAPARMERLMPARDRSGVATSPAWVALRHGPEVEIEAPRADLHPSVTFATTVADADGGRHGRVTIGAVSPGAEVTVDASGGRQVSVIGVGVGAARVVADVDPGRHFELALVNARLAGADLDAPEASESLRVELSNASPTIRVEGGPQSLAVRLMLAAAPADGDRPLLSDPLPVRRIAFEREGLDGTPVSTLLAQAELRYLDHPSVPARSIPPGHFIHMEPEAAVITVLAATRLGSQAALRLELSGRMAALRSGAQADVPPIDHRLTRFEVLKADPTLVALLAVAGWVFATTLAAWRLWKDVATSA